MLVENRKSGWLRGRFPASATMFRLNLFALREKEYPHEARLHNPANGMNDRLDLIEAKLDTIIHKLDARPDRQKYLTAKDVGELVGLDHRTILNRSNLDSDDPRYIPSLKLRGSRRKYFERKVIERLFSVDE